MNPYRHKVNYYECDRMGVTHHSNYPRFMEETRIYLMDELGYGFEKMEAEGVVSPVMSLTCDYKHTTTFQDVIEIDLKILEMTPLKMKFGYVMKVGDTVVCKASSLHCFLDSSTGRPVVIKDRFPGLYEAMKQYMDEQ